MLFTDCMGRNTYYFNTKQQNHVASCTLGSRSSNRQGPRPLLPLGGVREGGAGVGAEGVVRRAAHVPQLHGAPGLPLGEREGRQVQAVHQVSRADRAVGRRQY